MAESLVAVTQGSGKNLHTFNRTIGASSVEDEVVLLGENYLASYLVSDGDYSTATANSHLLQIMAGASLKVRIRRIELDLTAVATAVAIMGWAVFRLTTAGTGGTVVAVQALDTTDSAAGATAMSLPTVKATEGVRVASGGAYMMQTLGASAQLANPIIVLDFDRPRSKPLIIPAGATNGIAIKNTTAIAGATIRYRVWFDESNF